MPVIGAGQIQSTPVVTRESPLMALVRAIGSRDVGGAERTLRATPELALASVETGATRQEAVSYHLDGIHHYVYAGDTALHIAAAAHRPGLVAMLLEAGANVGARNRRGAEPLHYAADSNPDSDTWDPSAQAAVIKALVAAGADPNATDKSGVAPLHRAVRTRSAPAVQALLEAGADPNLENGSGSPPMKLATHTTGRGGSGSPAAREQQSAIIQLLETYGAEG